MSVERLRAWPKEAGEVAGRLRERDWERTPLGDAASWPATLRSTVELILPHAFPMAVLWGPDLVQFHNDAFLALFGAECASALGAPALDACPQLWAALGLDIEAVRRGGTKLMETVRVAAGRDGPPGERCFTVTGSPIRQGGEVAGVLVTLAGTPGEGGEGGEPDGAADDRKSDGVPAAKGRRRGLAEGIPPLVWRAAALGEWTWASPQWTEFTGQPEGESRGWGWLRCLHPADVASARAAWAEAGEVGRLQAAYRVRRASDRAYRWFQTEATPVRDAQGRPVEWLGASTDVEDLHALQDRQALLLHELQHRVRNILAVVRSITLRTGETSDTVEGFASHLGGRLDALARTQMVLTRSPGEGVDLETMIREEMLAQAAEESHVAVEGPDVSLPAKAAEVIALALHELATNAVKYGALSSAGGRVRIAWRTEEWNDRRWLKLVWEEAGVRVASPAPRRKGFGTELIEMRIAYELRGRGVLEFQPGGLRCRIEFPLRAAESILQVGAPVASAERED